MGILIEGDPRPQSGRLYTIGEIAQASGIKTATLTRRRKILGIAASPRGYTYEQAKQMILKPVAVKRRPDAERVNRLKKQLQNDGLL